jgi:hypothetical protein
MARVDAAVPMTAHLAVPTVQVPVQTPIAVPTLSVPQPRPTVMPKPKPKPRPKAKAHHSRRPSRTAAKSTAPSGQWITAYLTSYCPGSAGWLSSSGQQVFYGMLANNFYAFGTRVYIPVVGITGVVEDHIGMGAAWNHFDVWSPVCYSTPTGYFKVMVLDN